MKSLILSLLPVLFYAPVNASENNSPDGKTLYQQYCSSCHHPERYGVSGPPLISETIGKRKDAELSEIIKNGLPATNMPSFKSQLRDEEILSIVTFIKTPASGIKWGANDMLLTRHFPESAGLAKKPTPDMTNLFMIVEGGKGLVHYMDGDTFTLLDKVQVGAIHGGPKFDNGMKNAYLGGRDGWAVRYSLTDWKEVGRIRVGINTRNIAISPDGKLLAAANSLPENIVIIDTDTMKPVKVIDAPGKPSAVYALKKTNSFVICFRGRSELWFVDYLNLSVRQVKVDQPFSDFFIEPGERYFTGTARDGKHVSVFDLSEGKVVSTAETTGMPHLASAAIWSEGTKTFAAFPHIGSPTLTIMETGGWTVKGTVTMKGSGFFARTHDNIDAVWVDTGTDTIQLVDKKSLKVVNEVVPAPGKKAMHIEFTKNGKYALVSVWENDGAVVIYDTSTLKEVKRLPFAKPVGKYNATNKKY